MPVAKMWKAGCLILWAAAVGPCQTVSSTTNQWFVAGGQLGTVGAVASAPAGPHLQPVTGAPYSAEQVTETVQTLANGTHITQTTGTTLMYRDSAGRTRIEHKFTTGTGVSVSSMILITDPAEGYEYTLEPPKHLARRLAWPPQMHSHLMIPALPARESTSAQISPAQPAISAAQPTSDGDAQPHPEVEKESLGTQTMEGISVEGTRTTITYPAGMMGNDQPITTVTETWTSPELKVVVLQKRSDPRNGDSTTKLTNLSQTEPDPSLFEVPGDYTIEDAQQPSAVAH